MVARETGAGKAVPAAFPDFVLGSAAEIGIIAASLARRGLGMFSVRFKTWGSR
jgi:hypothetical protein